LHRGVEVGRGRFVVLPTAGWYVDFVGFQLGLSEVVVCLGFLLDVL